MNAKRSTSKDVAALAGVNQSTVSRALTHDGDVADATRTRILKAAARLRYTPNALARGLIQQKTNIIGIVMAGITSPFQSYVLEKFVKKLHGAGRQALVFSAAQGEEVDDVLPAALQYHVEALVITSAPLWSQKIEDVVSRVPVVLFNRGMPGSKAHTVLCDNATGGRKVAEYLIKLGHTRFGYVAGNANTSTNADRERGFTQRVGQEGFACAREQATYGYETGYAAMQRLMQPPDRPSAVFCASDIVAMGAIDAARALGLHVGRDVSVAGFDDIPMAGWEAYQLTTVHEPVDEMIDATVMLLGQLREDGAVKGRSYLFDGALVERASTGRRR